MNTPKHSNIMKQGLFIGMTLKGRAVPRVPLALRLGAAAYEAMGDTRWIGLARGLRIAAFLSFVCMTLTLAIALGSARVAPLFFCGAMSVTFGLYALYKVFDIYCVLRPLASEGDRSCSEALALVKGNPSCAAWRDHVLQEGRQLLVADLMYMKALDRAFASPEDLERRAKFGYGDASRQTAQQLSYVLQGIVVTSGLLIICVYSAAPNVGGYIEALWRMGPVVFLLGWCLAFSLFVNDGLNDSRLAWHDAEVGKSVDQMANDGNEAWAFLRGILDSGASPTVRDVGEAQRKIKPKVQPVVEAEPDSERNAACRELHRIA